MITFTTYIYRDNNSLEAFQTVGYMRNGETSYIDYIVFK